LKKSLRILFLCSWYPSRVLPTNGDFIQRHAEAVALMHKVVIIHVISDKNVVQNIEITDTIINNIRTLIAYVKPTKNPLIKYFRYKKAHKQLLQKIKKIDIVHVHKLFPVGLIALKLKRNNKVPYIITEHHSRYHKPYNKQIGFIEKMWSKIIVKNAFYIAPVSTDLGKSMQNFGLVGNYYTVPNVIDTTQFLAKKETNNGIFNILHVSNMVALKNVKGILKVIKKLESKIDDFHFYCIGGKADSYKKIAIELGVNSNTISFINQLPHNELISYFQNANVFVLFSQTENQPCVIPESFSCGTPVISTDVGGISEYFPKGFGILIEPNNEVELLQAILKIHTAFNRKSPIKMHQYVTDNFGKQQICKEFTKLYLRTLKLN